MAESTLSLTRTQLRSHIGFYLGYGTNSANWTSDQASNIDYALDAGTRRFYFPFFNGDSHEWSFLKINGTVATTASDYDYDFTEQFGGIEGWLTYSITDNTGGPVEVVPELYIRQLRENSGGTTGRPRYAAIRAKAPALTSTGQIYEIIFWPTPDAVYTLTYRGTVNPDAMSASLIYPYGGMQHAETLRECCLWAAEEFFNDQADGVHKRAAQERLAASVQRDRIAFQPENFGYNGDRSDGDNMPPPHYANNITRNGISYY